MTTAWTAAVYWNVGQMVEGGTAGTNNMNTFWRDNLEFFDQHKHSGAAGAGAQAIGTLTVVTFTDTTASPTGTGQLQRKGTNLEFHNSGTVIVVTAVNPGGTTAGLLNLDGSPTGGTSGTHAH
jgi:hypothetical protein